MRVYLAGPEVFLPDCREIQDKKAAVTREYGFVPVVPGDDVASQGSEMPAGLTPREKGLFISQVNENLMLSADMIIANLTPYRGISADAGTVYELGFMCGRGCPAYGFTNVIDGHFERVKAYYHGDVRRDDTGRLRGSDGLEVEDYDLVDNLMLDGGVAHHGGGEIVRHQAAPDALYTDLTGFRKCLEIAAAALLK